MEITVKLRWTTFTIYSWPHPLFPNDFFQSLIYTSAYLYLTIFIICACIYADKTLQFDIEVRKLKILPPKNKKPRLVNVPKSLMRELKLFVDDYLELKNKMGDAWNLIKDDDGTPLNLNFTKNQMVIHQNLLL